MPARPAHLLLIDDHALFRTGLRLIVQEHPEVGAISEAGSIAEACALAQDAPVSGGGGAVDLVLLDIMLPGMNGFDGMPSLRKAFPQARIVFVSASVAPDGVREARARGADGFLSKSASGNDILQAIGAVLAGQPCFAVPASSGPLPDGVALTPRQRDVLRLLSAGKPNKVIARQLDLSESTVRGHVTAIFAQLGVDNRSAALLRAQHLGLVDVLPAYAGPASAA